MLKKLKNHTIDAYLSKKERRLVKRVYRHELVKCSALLRTAAAWVITVPVSTLTAALLFYMNRSMMIPKHGK